MINVRDNLRHTDKIWNSFNKFSAGKQTGGINDTEFSDLLINIGDLFANSIKLGKVNQEEIELYKSYLSQFLGENKDNYFNFSHKGLDRATKTNYESINVASDYLVERNNMYAKPSMTEEERNRYTLGFRKLGN